MRAFPWILVLVSVGWMGCTLDSEGQGQLFPEGKDGGGAGGVGGSGGTGQVGGSGGSGGTDVGGSGGTGEVGGSGGSGGTGVGGTGATGGTGGTGATGGTGGATGPEDCTNGVDDNGDNLADCEDPQCQPDYVCVPEPPSGWSTVGYQAPRDFAAPATNCAPFNPSGLALNDGLLTPNTGCGCGCASPTGGQCSASATLYQNSNCSGGNASMQTGCYNFSNTWRIAGVSTGNTSVATAGTCAPSTTGSLDNAGWSKAVDLCLAGEVGAGCAAGSVCVAKSTGALESSACVEQAGNVACPASYPAQHIYYAGFDDTRSCTASGCSCSAASGQSCQVSVALYDNNDCSGQPAGQYPLDGTCHATGFGYGDVGSGQYVGTISGGSCSSSGTAGIAGEAVPTGPHTVCCLGP